MQKLLEQDVFGKHYNTPWGKKVQNDLDLQNDRDHLYIDVYYYIRHKAETQENRWFF